MLSSRIFNGSNPYTSGNPVMEMWGYIDEQIRISAIKQELQEAEERLGPDRPDYSPAELHQHLSNIVKRASDGASAEEKRRGEASRNHVYTHPVLSRGFDQVASRRVTGGTGAGALQRERETTSELTIKSRKGRPAKGDDDTPSGDTPKSMTKQRADDLRGAFIAKGLHVKHAQDVLNKSKNNEADPKLFRNKLVGGKYGAIHNMLRMQQQRAMAHRVRAPEVSLDAPTGDTEKETVTGAITGTDASKARIRAGDADRKKAAADEKEREPSAYKKDDDESQFEPDEEPDRSQLPLKTEPWVGASERTTAGGGGRKGRTRIQARALALLDKHKDAAKVSGKPVDMGSVARELGMSTDTLDRTLHHGTTEPEIPHAGPKPRLKGTPSDTESKASMAGWHEKIAKLTGLTPEQVRKTTSGEGTGHEVAVAAAAEKLKKEGERRPHTSLAAKVRRAAADVHHAKRVAAAGGEARLDVSPGYRTTKQPKEMSLDDLRHAVTTPEGKKVLIKPSPSLTKKREQTRRLAGKFVSASREGRSEVPADELAAAAKTKSGAGLSQAQQSLRLQLAPVLAKDPKHRYRMKKVRERGPKVDRNILPGVSKAVAAEVEKRKDKPVAPPSGKLLPREKMQQLLAAHRKQVEMKKAKAAELPSAEVGGRLTRQTRREFLTAPSRTTKKWLKGLSAKKQAEKREKEKEAERKWALKRKVSGKDQPEPESKKLPPEELGELKRKIAAGETVSSKEGPRRIGGVVSKKAKLKRVYKGRTQLFGTPDEAADSIERGKESRNVKSEKERDELISKQKTERSEREAEIKRKIASGEWKKGRGGTHYSDLSSKRAEERAKFLRSLGKTAETLPKKVQPTAAERRASRRRAKKRSRQDAALDRLGPPEHERRQKAAQKMQNILRKQRKSGRPNKFGPKPTEEQISRIFLTGLTEGLITIEECAHALFGIRLTEDQAEHYVSRWFNETLAEGWVTGQTVGTSLFDRVIAS